MINLQQHLHWNNYYMLVILVTIWNLGFTAITRKGKLLYPILKFFEKKRAVEVKALPEGNKKFNEEMSKAYVDYLADLTTAEKKNIDLLSKITFVKFFLEHRNPLKYYSKKEYAEIAINMGDNLWYYDKMVDVYPDLIKDPIVACITCMASVHGLSLYVIYCLYHHQAWNPIEQLAISVPVAFLGEFLWKLKLRIEK